MTRHRMSAFAAVAAAFVAGPAAAQGFQSGELTLSYTGYDLSSDFGGSNSSYGVSARAAYGLGYGLGMQLGIGYLGYDDDAIGFEDYYGDLHLYLDSGQGLKAGVFVTGGELAAFDANGAPDIGGSMVAYGGEAMYDMGALSINSYAGAADTDDVDNYRFFGFGADYVLNSNWELVGDFKHTLIEPDGIADDLTVKNATIGVNYYTGSAFSNPMRLSATVGRSWADYDSFGEDSATTLGLSATFSFGSNGAAGEDKLFEPYVLPF